MKYLIAAGLIMSAIISDRTTVTRKIEVSFTDKQVKELLLKESGEAFKDIPEDKVKIYFFTESFYDEKKIFLEYEETNEVK